MYTCIPMHDFLYFIYGLFTINYLFVYYIILYYIIL